MAVLFTKRGPAFTLPQVSYVNYLESTGTQFIRTNVVPNQDTRVDIVAVPMSVAEANPGDGFILYGAGQSYNDRAFECYTSTGRYQFNYNGQCAYIGNPAIGQNLVISHNKEIVTLLQDGVEIPYVFPYGEFETPYEMTLFAINRGSLVYCGLSRIFQCQIYDNGVLIRDFRPCVDFDGVPCMYDEVSQEFYYNAGTGEFLVG